MTGEPPGIPFDGLDRYHRQMLLPGFGTEAQARLRAAHAIVVGCGALGCVIVDVLARAGIGVLTIVDRDVVEITNLQRQVLFDEHDVAGGVPKAEAAKAKVAAINRQVIVHARVDDFNVRNAERHADGADILLDGLDNFETRYLLNDLAVKRGLPYVYGGAVGTTGVSYTVLPHPAHRAGPPRPAIRWDEADSTPCLRCIFPEAPPPGASPTCDTAGVLGPVILTIAAHQAAQALKLITGHVPAVDRALLSIDAWTNETRRFDVSGARRAGTADRSRARIPDTDLHPGGRASPAIPNDNETPSCPCCGAGRFDFLHGAATSTSIALCGRDAVQITPPAPVTAAGLDLAGTSRRLAPHGTFTHNDHVLRGTFASERGPEGHAIELTLFPDGRAIIKGTSEVEAARSLYARYVGS